MKLNTLLSYASGSAAVALLTFLTLPVMAWSFTPEAIGKLVMLQVVCSLFAVIFSLGLDQSYVREFNEVTNKPALAKICFFPGLLVLIIFFILMCLFKDILFSIIFPNSDEFYYLAVALGSIILYLERYFSVFIRMQEWPIAYSITKFIPKLLFLGFVLFAFIYVELQSVNLLLFFQILSWVVSVVVMVFFLSSFLYLMAKADHTFNTLPQLFSFGLPLMLNGIAFWGLTYVDRLMLAKLSSFADVGLYAMAAGFAGVAMLFQQIFSTVWHPTIYRWVSEGFQFDKLKTISSALEFLSFMLIGLLGCFSWILTLFLPEEYKAIEFIVVACMVQPLLIMISEVSGIGISVSRKTKLLPVLTLFALIVNIALNFVLIPKFGAAGAAVSAAVSTSLYLFMKTELSSKLWYRQPKSKLYFYMALSLLGSIVQCLLFKDETMYSVLFWFLFTITLCFSYKDLIMNFSKLRNGIN